jgi:hypothetical protein
MTPTRFFSLISSFAISFATVSADAQTSTDPPTTVVTEEAPPALRLPVAAAERPLTLPRLVLRPSIDFDVTHETGVAYPNLDLSVALGITDWLVVRATVLPLQLSPFHYGEDSEYVGPRAGATIRFLKGVVEMGLSADAGPYTLQNITGVVIEPGIPVYIHASKKTRISTGLDLTIRDYKQTVRLVAANTVVGTETSQSFTSETLQIPVAVLYNIVDTFYVSANSGVEHVFRSSNQVTQIPVGVAAAYTIAGKQGPLLQLEPFFTFFSILTPGSSDATHTASWRLGLNVDAYFYL